jgi:predicted nuclease with TOPRIM domain
MIDKLTSIGSDLYLRYTKVIKSNADLRKENLRLRTTRDALLNEIDALRKENESLREKNRINNWPRLIAAQVGVTQKEIFKKLETLPREFWK